MQYNATKFDSDLIYTVVNCTEHCNFKVLIFLLGPCWHKTYNVIELSFKKKKTTIKVHEFEKYIACIS